MLEKDEINVPITLIAFRDGDQGPSKVTKTELRVRAALVKLICRSKQRPDT